MTRCVPSGGLPTAPLPSSGKLSYLALGDSYTIGESVAESARFPVQLASALRAEGLDLSAPEIIARTGWTTTELSAAMDVRAPSAGRAMVTLLIGVNDQYRGGNAADYRPRFVALLKRAIALADGAPKGVVVLSIPDWGVTPFAPPTSSTQIAAAIDAFNAANAEEARRAGVAYVDVTPISREVPRDPSLVAADGLHPSGAQYAEWACLALGAARAALSR